MNREQQKQKYLSLIKERIELLKEANAAIKTRRNIQLEINSHE